MYISRKDAKNTKKIDLYFFFAGLAAWREYF
jgi:hypothetical protein